jgi:hypothetical protein
LFKAGYDLILEGERTTLYQGTQNQQQKRQDLQQLGSYCKMRYVHASSPNLLFLLLFPFSHLRPHLHASLFPLNTFGTAHLTEVSPDKINYIEAYIRLSTQHRKRATLTDRFHQIKNRKKK